MEVYRPARQYLPASLTAFALAMFSAWCGIEWAMAFLPAGLFVLSALLLGYLGTRPPIEISEDGLRIGARMLRWSDIRSIESTSWNSPLVLNLTLSGGESRRLVYPGDVASADRLLRQFRRLARGTAVDGVVRPPALPETAPIRVESRTIHAPRPRLLRAEDEEDVRRIYRKLKRAGRSVHGADERSDGGQ